MDKTKNILKTQFGIECIDIAEIHGGLSAMNYKVKTGNKCFFLKVYDKKKSQASIWTENINWYMPILVWLNENTKLQERIVRPIKTNKSYYQFEDDENVFLLFDYIEGETVGKNMTRVQVIEAADIMACLHKYGSEIPFNTDKIKEDFSVPFCFSLEHYITKNYTSSPADVKAILQPCLEQLIAKNNELIALSEQVKLGYTKMVLCHTDAHGWNLMQGEHLYLVDWEGIKLAPAEADLTMFTKKDYWDTFIEHYNKLRPEFKLDNDILMFYILRRKIEDIWAFIESILFDNLSNQQRERDLTLLSECCSSLNNLYFEL